MRVVELINISNVKVEVMLANGVTMYLPPRGRLIDEDIKNLDEIRRYCKITQVLQETAKPPAPAKKEKKDAKSGS